MNIETFVVEAREEQSLESFKFEMFYALNDIKKYHEQDYSFSLAPVYGVFNDELYVVYPWAKSIDDIDTF